VKCLSRLVLHGAPLSDRSDRSDLSDNIVCLLAAACAGVGHFISHHSSLPRSGRCGAVRNQNHRLSRWYAPRLQGDDTGNI
jgi:hypothetical protein